MELRYWSLLIFLGAIWGSAFMFIKIATPELGAVFLSSVTPSTCIISISSTFN